MVKENNYKCHHPITIRVQTLMHNPSLTEKKTIIPIIKLNSSNFQKIKQL